MHPSRAGQYPTEDQLRRLEQESNLFKQLVQVIQASSTQQDSQIISILRNASTPEKLEKDLHSLRGSTREDDSEQPQDRSKD